MLGKTHTGVLRHPVYDLLRRPDRISRREKQNQKRGKRHGGLYGQKRLKPMPFRQHIPHAEKLKHQQHRPHLLDRHRGNQCTGNGKRKFPRAAPLRGHMPAALSPHRFLGGKEILRKRHQRPHAAGKAPGIKNRSVHPHRRVADRPDTH